MQSHYGRSVVLFCGFVFHSITRLLFFTPYLSLRRASAWALNLCVVEEAYHKRIMVTQIRAINTNRTSWCENYGKYVSLKPGAQ